MLKQWIGLLGSLVLFLGSPGTAVASSPLHWQRKGNHPIVVTVHDQTRDDLWGHALRKHIDQWNAGIVGIDLVFHPDAGNDNCDTGRGAYTVVVCVKENVSPNNVGEAYLYQDGNHIAYVTIWMDPRPDPGRHHLACHELGHALGLGHRGANENSCMTNGPRKRPEHPDQKDFKAVTQLHSHTH